MPIITNRLDAGVMRAAAPPSKRRTTRVPPSMKFKNKTGNKWAVGDNGQPIALLLLPLLFLLLPLLLSSMLLSMLLSLLLLLSVASTSLPFHSRGHIMVGQISTPSMQHVMCCFEQYCSVRAHPLSRCTLCSSPCVVSMFFCVVQ